MYRLYVDEVGTDDLTNVEADNDRYLSLTGVAMETGHARDQLAPKFDWIKANVFEHDPDEPVIFHRKKIVKRKGPFGVLNDDAKRSLFDKAILRVFERCEYTVITAQIDKKAMLKQANWRNQHPYHFLMEILAEKYAQFLERKKSIGDIMPEGRKGIKDAKLQEAFEAVKRSGTYYVSRERMRSVIPSDNLKFRYKDNDVAGLQLADLLAHPSHIVIREMQQHPVEIGDFCSRVKQLLLDAKYDRSNNGKIIGYGVKWLP